MALSQTSLEKLGIGKLLKAQGVFSILIMVNDLQGWFIWEFTIKVSALHDSMDIEVFNITLVRLRTLHHAEEVPYVN